MKFSDISKEEWQDLQPYLDTCLLPVTGLTGREQPWEATEALEKLRDALELIEIPYKGRVVTYPALHYVDDKEISTQLDTLSSRIKEAGFTFVIVVTTDPNSEHWSKESLDDIYFVDMQKWSEQQREIKAQISKQLQQLWQRGRQLS
jgi:23S rRNA (pseudouridine1915-N3)-methyltransferase